MRPASGHDDLLDPGFADQAGLAFASVGAVLELEETFLAIGVDVIRNGRPTCGDRLRKYFAQSDSKSLQLAGSQRVGTAAWPHSRAEKSLVGIDVSDAVQQRLIQQQRLDRRLAAMKKLRELLGTDVERLLSRTAKDFAAHLKPAKPSRIDKPQLTT